MRTAILEILANSKAAVSYSPIKQIIEPIAAEHLHQLLCDCMATAMYRCMEHIPLDQQGLVRVRLAEYGFSKEEIDKAISKLENE